MVASLDWHPLEGGISGEEAATLAAAIVINIVDNSNDGDIDYETDSDISTKECDKLRKMLDHDKKCDACDKACFKEKLEIDVDNDGDIDMKELAKALIGNKEEFPKAEAKLDEAELKALFNLLNTDGDDGVEENEWNDGVADVMLGYTRFFNDRDEGKGTTRDGKIPLEDMNEQEEFITGMVASLDWHPLEGGISGEEAADLFAAIVINIVDDSDDGDIDYGGEGSDISDKECTQLSNMLKIGEKCDKESLKATLVAMDTSEEKGAIDAMELATKIQA